jgi:hypothetical protein
MHIKKRVFVLLALLVAIVAIPAAYASVTCTVWVFPPASELISASNPYGQNGFVSERKGGGSGCAHVWEKCEAASNCKTLTSRAACNFKDPSGKLVEIEFPQENDPAVCHKITPKGSFSVFPCVAHAMFGLAHNTRTVCGAATVPPPPQPVQTICPLVAGASANPPSVIYNGETYARALGGHATLNTGDAACAAIGETCIVADVRTDAVCKLFHANAASTSSLSGDVSGVYCDGWPQTNVCGTKCNTCHVCPQCSKTVTCKQDISNLYREMYFRCSTTTTATPPPPPPTPPILPPVLKINLSTANGTVLTGENVQVDLQVHNPSSAHVRADVDVEVCASELSVAAGNPSLSLIASGQFQNVDDLLAHWTSTGGFSLRGQVSPNLIQEMNNYMGNGAYELVIRGYTPPGAGKLTFATCAYSWGGANNEVCMNLNYWRTTQNKPYVRGTFFFDSKKQFWDAYNAHNTIFIAGLDFNQGRLECARYVPVVGSPILGAIQWVTTCPTGTTCQATYCEPTTPPVGASPYYTVPPTAPTQLPLSSSITTAGISPGALYTPATLPQLHYCAGTVERLTWSVSLPPGATESYFATYGTLAGYPVDVVAGFSGAVSTIAATTTIDLAQPWKVGPFSAGVSAQLGILPGDTYPIYNLSNLLFVLNITDINMTVPNITLPFALPANLFLPGFNGSVSQVGTMLIISKNPVASPATDVACSGPTVNAMLRATTNAKLTQLFLGCQTTARSLAGVVTGTGTSTGGSKSGAVSRLTGGSGGSGGRSSIISGATVGQVIQGAAQTLQASADLAKVGVDTVVNAVRNVANLFNPIDPSAVTSATCEDKILNQGEVRLDCGGPCPPCITTEKPGLVPSGVWVAGFLGLALLLSILVVTLMIQQRGRGNKPGGRQDSLSDSFRPQS